MDLRGYLNIKGNNELISHGKHPAKSVCDDRKDNLLSPADLNDDESKLPHRDYRLANGACHVRDRQHQYPDGRLTDGTYPVRECESELGGQTTLLADDTYHVRDLERQYHYNHLADDAAVSRRSDAHTSSVTWGEAERSGSRPHGHRRPATLAPGTWSWWQRRAPDHRLPSDSDAVNSADANNRSPVRPNLRASPRADRTMVVVTASQPARATRPATSAYLRSSGAAQLVVVSFVSRHTTTAAGETAARVTEAHSCPPPPEGRKLSSPRDGE
ncbi:hypothetical protein C0Q70_15020 [Pomacea canaliculata]|uniref:Uncharacterized protein n=1 Tax=Pomacea canaliculata TaxID=400727 RepID=A0A2T7NTN4_POMCA|nr:hypothetical protein C0Q70_15020 [Pomacea canaliculata]